MTIRIVEQTGDFAEDKDIAASIRERHVRRTLDSGGELILDFSGVGLVTQSFIHALISDVLRKTGEQALKGLVFKGCNEGVRGMIETVVQYSLEGSEDEDD